MYKCWTRYGKSFIKPDIVEQHLKLFMRTEKNIESKNSKEHIWVLVPLFTISQNEGLPILMEGSHHNSKDQKPFSTVVKPGQALMFDARIKTEDPSSCGGVVFARRFDVTGM